jgi:hypothetical protein
MVCFRKNCPEDVRSTLLINHMHGANTHRGKSFRILVRLKTPWFANRLSPTFELKTLPHLPAERILMGDS